MKHNVLKPVPSGLKMKIFHEFRPEKLRAYSAGSKHAPRYQTIALLVDPTTGEIESFGWANCSPRDTPSRKMGRLIAHNRAVTLYEKYAHTGADQNV